MSERVAIIGARAHPDLDQVRAFVRELPEGTVVISGGAEGVDLAAETEAVERGLMVVSYRITRSNGIVTMIEVVHRASQEGWIETRRWRMPHDCSYRDALIFRNTFIAVSCERMEAFTTGSKGGSMDAIRQAKRFRRPVKEHP